jgi:hypothetical protein
MPFFRTIFASVTTLALLMPAAVWAQGSSVVYRCPGNVYTSDQEISAKQAIEKGCKTIEGAPITVIQGSRPRTGNPVPAASGPRPADSRVDPGQQRTRDNDARRILENELRAEQERLTLLQKDFNNGEPERRGDERNYQKYLDRVAEMKAAIARKQSDIAAIERELAKLPK